MSVKEDLIDPQIRLINTIIFDQSEPGLNGNRSVFQTSLRLRSSLVSYTGHVFSRGRKHLPRM